jgi:hypothetical protein
MAILKTYGVEIHINFYGIDDCGDILYAYRFICNGKNIINPELLNEKWKNGIFITTECDFEESGVINYFKRIITTKTGENYESLEPPIIYIGCRAWNEVKEYSIRSWKSATHWNGQKKYSDEGIDSFMKYWEKDISLTFSIDNDYLVYKGPATKISITVSTTTDILELFVKELEQEFGDFKNSKKEESYIKVAKN